MAGYPAAHLTPQMIIDFSNGQLIVASNIIYAARSVQNPALFYNHPLLYNNLVPEIQANVDLYNPNYPPIVNNGGIMNLRVLTLTPWPDISMFGGAPVMTVRRDGANGNALRAMAMAYKPAGLHLVLNLPPDMSDAMYSFYGKSHLEIMTGGNSPIYLNRFHPDVTSLDLTSYVGTISSLDPIVDRVVNNPDQSFRYILKAKVRPAPASSTRRTIRTLIMTMLNNMQTSTNPTLKMNLVFLLGTDPERDDEDAHTYLENLASQTQGMNYSKNGRVSRINKPAHQNIPQRSFELKYNTVGPPLPRCSQFSLSVDTS